MHHLIASVSRRLDGARSPLFAALLAAAVAGCTSEQAIPSPSGGSGGSGSGGMTGNAGSTGSAGTSASGGAGATGIAGTGGAGGRSTGTGGGGVGGTAAGRGGNGGTTTVGGAGGSAGTGQGGRGGAGGAAGASGAVGTAGSIGTGGAGGWSLGGGSRCAGATYVVCEDFESTAVGATPAGDWSLPATNYGTGTLAVASDQAARGSHALKVTIPAGGSSVERYLQRKNITALANGHFGRIFFRVEGPTTTPFVHWDMILGAGMYTGQSRRIRWGVTGTGVGTTNNNWAWIYNIEQGDTGVEARTVHPVVNSWMCVEWQWDAANQKIRFYFGDVEAQSLHVDTTLPNGTALQVPTFSSLSFGLAKYQSTDADLVFWIDEIALDTQRIGCSN